MTVDDKMTQPAHWSAPEHDPSLERASDRGPANINEAQSAVSSNEVVKPKSAPRVAAREASSADEAVLEPDLEIVDPHIHIFDDRTSNYTLNDVTRDANGTHRVTELVFIECQWAWDTSAADPLMAPLGEMRRITQAATSSALTPGATISRVVGHVDLRYGTACGPALDKLADESAGLLTGIRHGTTWDPHPTVKNNRTNPPPGVMLTPEFQAGIAELASRNLSFDTWVYHHQLDEVAAIARAQPDLTVVVDHLGGPLVVGPYATRQVEVRSEWREKLSELAALPNVCLKLGGIGFPLMVEPENLMAVRTRETSERMRATGLDPAIVPPTSEELAKHWSADILWCIEMFGVHRCMFESNFPVDRVMCSYLVLWNTFKRIVADASPTEKAALFRDTARRVYRLPGPAGSDIAAVSPPDSRAPVRVLTE